MATDGPAVLLTTRWNGIVIEGYVAVYNGLAPISSLLPRRETDNLTYMYLESNLEDRCHREGNADASLRRAGLRALLAFLRPAARRLLRSDCSEGKLPLARVSLASCEHFPPLFFLGLLKVTKCVVSLFITGGEKSD